jgi:hypothetical protein
MTSTRANLWDSAATFRRDTAAKASFILLNQFDLFLTVLALYLGCTELNPFMRYLISVPALLVAVKLALPPLIAWLVPGKLLWPALAVLALVAIWNIKELVIYLV